MHLDSLYNILLKIKKLRCGVAFSWIVVIVEQLEYKELIGSGGAGRVRAAVLCCLCCYHHPGSEEAFCLPPPPPHTNPSKTNCKQSHKVRAIKAA